jgi:hypothetical protein
MLVVLGFLSGCEPPHSTGTAGVVSASKPGPPAPPPPPPDPTAIATEQPPVASETAPSPESPTLASDSGNAATSAIPGVDSATGLPTRDPILRPQSSAPTSTAPAPAQPLIRLSAGIALPQTLPDGTQIGVSVDYKLTGQLKSSARYALVVETSAGELAIPVKISPQGGTFQGFLPISVRPEHGPFSARIDEYASRGGKGVIVSNRISLR